MSQKHLQFHIKSVLSQHCMNKAKQAYMERTHRASDVINDEPIQELCFDLEYVEPEPPLWWLPMN